MSWKPTIITLALAIMAVIAALYVDRVEPSFGRRSAESTRPLVTQEMLPIDSVTRITLVRAGDEPMVFERSGLQWQQVEPFVCPMDSYSMRQLAAVAHQVQVVQRLKPEDMDESLTADTLGLDPPEAAITYAWDEGGELVLQLGRRGIAGRAYLRIDQDDEVLVVQQDLHRRVVEMDPREWRDRTIFENVGVESDRIVRNDGRTQLVLERDRRQWRMREPVDTRVNGQAMDQFLQALGGAQSRGFIADQPRDLNRFGLQPSAANIAVYTSHSGEAVEQRLHIGMPVGAGTQDRYGIVEGRPSVVRIPAAVIAALFLRHPETLIAQTGSHVQRADVRSIRIRTESGELELVRDMERWRAPEYANAEVPASYVDELLSQLTELQAGEISLQPYPAEMQVAVVTFTGFQGQPLDTVRIVHDPASGAWALENGDDVLRVFTSGFKPRLTRDDFGLSGGALDNPASN